MPAGAATAAHFEIVLLHSDVSPTKTPDAKIVGSGRTAVYNPTSLKVKEDTSGNECNTGYTSFTIHNTGKKTAYLAINGAPMDFPLNPGQLADVCIYGGSIGDTQTFGLTNAAGTVVYASMSADHRQGLARSGSQLGYRQFRKIPEPPGADGHPDSLRSDS